MRSEQCNKVQYSKREAETELNTLRRGRTIFLLGKRRKKNSKRPIRIYYCHEHNCWHLTSKTSHMGYTPQPRYKEFPIIENSEHLKELLEQFELILYSTLNCPRCNVLYDSLVAKGFISIIRVKTGDKTIYPAFPKFKSFPIIFYKGTELRGRRSVEILQEIKTLNRDIELKAKEHD